MLDEFHVWVAHAFSAKGLWRTWSVLVVAYAFWLLLERFFAAERAQPAAEKWRNIGVTFVYLTLAMSAGMAVASLGNSLARSLGGPLLDLDGVLPKYAAPFVALFLFDFFYYWFHRLQHAWAPLWAVHRLHHSDRALNVTTSVRHHWLEEPLRALFIVFPLALLVKISPVSAGLVTLLISQWGSFTHANLRVSFGRLSVLVSGPQWHRIHHSIEPRHRDRNFAAFFPVWDWLFRTHYPPDGWPRTGVAEHDGRAGLRDILLISPQR